MSGYRDPKEDRKRMKSMKMKRMILTGAAITVMMSLAAPAMAVEVQGHLNDPSGTTVIVDPVKDPGTAEVGIIVDPIREPLKDPGIRSCDLTPPGCQDTDADHHDTNDPNPGEEEPYKDPGIRQCDLTPPGCQDTEEEEDSVVCAAIYRLEDGKCVPLDDANDHGDNSDDDPDTDDPNLVEEEPKKEEASAPAQENDASAQKPVSASDEGGQIGYSETNPSPETYGCPYDYEYDEEYDACLPSPETMSGGFYDVVLGDAPWPDSAGGYVGLVGGFGKDTLTAVGAGLTIGLGHYVGDTLVEFGKDGGPIGWGIQGLGYTLGFTGDALGVLVGGAGEIVGAATDVVGAVVDGIGDAAEDVWDEISSWF
jgi:hypothetical protein